MTAPELPRELVVGEARYVLDPTQASPAYRGVPGGGLAVPTGRVFVRFDEGTRAADREPELRRAGYVLDEIPSFAPHAAWVVAAAGGVAAGLAGLSELARVAGLRHAEPELHRPRAKRS